MSTLNFRHISFVALLLIIITLASSSSQVVSSHHHHHHHHHHHAPHSCIHDTHVVPALQKIHRDGELPLMPKTTTASRRSSSQQQQQQQQQGSDSDGGPVVGPIRIAVRTNNLYDAAKYCTSATGTAPDMLGGKLSGGVPLPCSAATILTDAKRDIILNELLPQAIATLSRALGVHHIFGPVKAPPAGTCGPDLTIPADDINYGINDTDYLLYVSAAPTPKPVLAWATPCALWTDDETNEKHIRTRPGVGMLNFNPEFAVIYTRNDSHVNADASAGDYDFRAKNRLTVRTILHELIHAMGFSKAVFLSPDAHLVQHNLGIVPPLVTTATELIRNKPHLKRLTSKNVLLMGRAFFDCPSLGGVELEDQGGAITAGSHFERRNLRGELMSGGIVLNEEMSLSHLTLATFADAGGAFDVNWTAAEPMRWFKNSGCSFLSDTCGKVSGGLGTYWCNMTDDDMCTFDRKATGKCSWTTYPEDIQPAMYRQYPNSPNQGGYATDLMDYCASVYQFENRGCTNFDYTATANEKLFGFSFGSSSRCIHAPGLIKRDYQEQEGSSVGSARCLEVRCPDFGERIQIRVGGGGGKEAAAPWLNCPLDGSAGTISAAGAGYDGSIECPTAKEICSGSPELIYTGTDDGDAGTSSTTTKAPTTTTTTAEAAPPSTTTNTSTSAPALTSSLSSSAATTTTTGTESTTPTTTTSSSPSTLATTTVTSSTEAPTTSSSRSTTTSASTTTTTTTTTTTRSPPPAPPPPPTMTPAPTHRRNTHNDNGGGDDVPSSNPKDIVIIIDKRKAAAVAIGVVAVVAIALFLYYGVYRRRLFLSRWAAVSDDSANANNTTTTGGAAQGGDDGGAGDDGEEGGGGGDDDGNGDGDDEYDDDGDENEMIETSAPVSQSPKHHVDVAPALMRPPPAPVYDDDELFGAV